MGHPIDPDSLTSRIVALCTTERGASMREIIATTGGHPPSVNATVPMLVNKARLWRAGTRMLRRYFAHQAHAQAYALVFEAERAQRPAASKAPPKPKKPRQQAAKPTRTPKHGPALTVGSKNVRQSLQTDATVTWPAHVQIQRAPVCQDTRFTFIPPHGWQGEFTREWQQKRRHA